MGKRNPNRDRFYDVPAVFRPDALGVTRSATCWPTLDEYRGTREALAAAGLLPADRFPGLPGQNEVSATLWPRKLPRHPRQWLSTPGFVNVTRLLNGEYRIRRVVEGDEIERRLAAEKQRRERIDATRDAAEAAAKDLVRVSVLMPRSVAEENGLLRPRRACSHLRLVWSAVGAPS